MHEDKPNYPFRRAITEQVASVTAHASLQEMLSFERLLSDLSAAFIAVPIQEIDHAIDQGLARIVFALGIDRSTLSRVFPLTGRAEVTHSFAVEGVDPVPKRLIPARDSNPWALAKATANEPIVFASLDDLPAGESRQGELAQHRTEIPRDDADRGGRATAWQSQLRLCSQ